MVRVFTCTSCKKKYPVAEDVFAKFLSPELERKAVELANNPRVKTLELRFLEGCIKCKPEAKNMPAELHRHFQEIKMPD
jgi:hypothetical protein